jgi:hypothetical protein
MHGASTANHTMRIENVLVSSCATYESYESSSPLADAAGDDGEGEGSAAMDGKANNTHTTHNTQQTTIKTPQRSTTLDNGRCQVV